MPYDFSAEAKITNKKLAGELSKLTPLKAEEIEARMLRETSLVPGVVGNAID